MAALDAASAAAGGEDVKPDALMSDEEFDRVLLGEAGVQMRADNVPATLIRRSPA